MKKYWKKLSGLGVCFLALSLGWEAKAETVTINVEQFTDGGPESYECTPGGDPRMCNLRQAISRANAESASGNDVVINLGAGTFTSQAADRSTDDDNRSGDFDISLLNNRTVTIVGSGAAVTTIQYAVTGSLSERLFHVHNGSLILRNLKLLGNENTVNNAAINDGGAIAVESNASLTLDGVRITGFIASADRSNGRGEFCGAAISVKSNATLNVVSSRIDHNAIGKVLDRTYDVASFLIGDGVIGSSGSFVAYQAYLRGGAICNVGGTVNIERSMLDSNVAMRAGGAISNDRGGRVNIKNTYLVSNNASSTYRISRSERGFYGVGGAIVNTGSTSQIHINNSTIAYNYSNVQGAGVSNGLPAYNGDISTAVEAGQVYVGGSLILDNKINNIDRSVSDYNYSSLPYDNGTPANCNSAITTQANNIVSDSSCLGLNPAYNDRVIPTTASPTILDTSYNFMPEGSSGFSPDFIFYPLRSSSPAIDSFIHSVLSNCA